MRIALLANGSRGDAQPLVVLGDELRHRGHQVVLGVSPNLVDFGERPVSQPIRWARTRSSSSNRQTGSAGWRQVMPGR